MSIEIVKAYFKQWNRDSDILEFDSSSATVELAAGVLGCIPARIAKTLSFKSGENYFLIVTAGDAKVDNSKFKAMFGHKGSMLAPDEVFSYTGHAVGGVCPFGIQNNEIAVYTDVSLKRFETVFPACGSSNSAIELTCDELFLFANSQGWIDVCKSWQE